jgi:hypothetical protein
MKTKPNTQLKASQGLTLSVAAFLAATSIAFAQDAPTAAPAEEPPAATPVAEVPAAAPPPPPPPAAPIVVAQPPPVAVQEPSPALAPAAKPAGIPVLNIGGTKISLYGFLQLNAIYDDGENGGKNWSNFALENAEDGEGRFLFNVNQTRIGFNLAGPQKESGAEITGRFESDFARSTDRNAHGNFRIRQAFGQVKFNDIGLSLLLGQTSDVIAPLTAPSLNQGALQGQGSLGTRRPMIRLVQVLGPTEITVAATDNREDSLVSPVFPGFQGSLKAKVPASWAGEKQNVELILSGHYASAEAAAKNKTEVDDKKDDDWEAPPSSWSGVVSLSLPIIDVINLSGEVFYGQNLSQYNVGSIGQVWKAVPDVAGKGLQSIGGWGALNIKLPADFALTGGLGIEALDEDREPLKGRNKNTVIFGNLKYNVAETAFIGVEYANVSTDYVDNTGAERETGSGTINRVELVFNYAFK